MIAKILVSACLLGRPVRYNGSCKPVLHPAFDQWQQDGRIVSICPELLAGFGVPRPPAEIANGRSGFDVLAGKGRVVDACGQDVTSLYVNGARAVLEIGRAHQCRYALLVDGSPSCGSSVIYDGSFAGRQHPGAGVTVALLMQNGVEVFAETDIDVLQARISENP